MKVIVTEGFTLKDFNKLKNIVRKEKDEVGKLFVGDKFECDEAMFNYLNGNNKYNKSYVVKVMENIPEEIKVEVSIDSEKAINKVKEIADNGGTKDEAIKEAKKIIKDTTKIKTIKTNKKKKTNKK